MPAVEEATPVEPSQRLASDSQRAASRQPRRRGPGAGRAKPAAQVQVDRGDRALRKGDTDQALAAFQAALSERADFPDAVRGIASTITRALSIAGNALDIRVKSLYCEELGRSAKQVDKLLEDIQRGTLARSSTASPQTGLMARPHSRIASLSSQAGKSSSKSKPKSRLGSPLEFDFDPDS